ncbi:hypothetical protein ACVH9Z_40435 [Rhodococcus opacus]|uniref:hypothetical protein n=1 Tax=Rhodococcus opacus TaxID=37919 RepID=UPI003211EC82
MPDEGKIRHIGLSEVSIDEVESASRILFGPLIFRRLAGHYKVSDEVAASSLVRTALRGLVRAWGIASQED